MVRKERDKERKERNMRENEEVTAEMKEKRGK